MKPLLNVNLYLKCFHFTCYLLGENIIVNINNMMNMLKDCTTFLIWAARFYLNFILISNKQKFSVWSFTENASFISSYGIYFLSRYSKINTYEISKNLFLQTMQDSKATSSISRLFVSLNSHYNDRLNIHGVTK